MKNPFPAYQWYARDFLSSTAHATMTLEEQGAYRNLLDRAWIDDPPCSLPDDDDELARLSGAGDRWPEMAPKIRRWFIVKKQRLWNAKQLKNFRELLRLRATRTEAAIKAGRKSAEMREKRGNQTLTLGSTIVNPATASSSATASSEDLERNVLPKFPKVNGSGDKRSSPAADVAAKILVRDIIDLTGDTQERSVKYFCTVAKKLDEQIVRRLISETRAAGADGTLRSAAKYFTALASKELAKVGGGSEVRE